ncbi:MAG: urate hydroxylase PuuD, partial [Burkholderiales bacterium]|nr:urate hydroxylase PuuD [Burkholderiales bacterium]
RGKQRSVHNTYFTLPVLIAMISNHYGWLYQGPNNWLVLVLLMLAGALIRHSFVARHKAHVLHKRTPWEHAVIGTLLLVLLAFWLAPAPKSAEEIAAAKAAAAKPITYADVRAIVDQRCIMCHGTALQEKGVDLHDAAGLKKNAQMAYQQAAVLKLMPLSNATQMTEIERDTIKRWYEAGAP